MAVISKSRFITPTINSTPPPPGPGVSLNDVVYSMYGAPFKAGSTVFGAHEGVMQRVDPTRDWAKGAVVHAGGPYPMDWTTPTGTFTGLQWHNGWFEIMAYQDPQPERRVRVQMTRFHSWTLNPSTHIWTQTVFDSTPGNPSGGYFPGEGKYSVTQKLVSGSTWRTETAANGGGWSLDTAPMSDSSGNIDPTRSIIHGGITAFSNPHPKIPTGGAFCISAKMRLIPSVAGVNVNNAKIIACVSADMFESATQTSGQAQPSAQNPRHVTLSDQWRWVGFATGTEAQIRAYPTLPFLGT